MNVSRVYEIKNYGIRHTTKNRRVIEIKEPAYIKIYHNNDFCLYTSEDASAKYGPGRIRITSSLCKVLEYYFMQHNCIRITYSEVEQALDWWVNLTRSTRVYLSARKLCNIRILCYM